VEEKMKKLMTALAVCAVAGFALAQSTVTSANVVGYQTITIKPGFTMLSANFAAVSNTPTSVSMQNLFATNGLYAGQTSGTADQIQIWDGSKFVIYYYQAYKSTVPNKFLAGPAWVKTPGTATTDFVPSGTGFWFNRPTSSALTSSVTVAGQVVSAATNVFALQQGFNMIGSSYPVAFPLNNGPFNWTNATAGQTSGTADQIQVWDGSKFTIYYYQMYKSTVPNKFLAGPAWVKTPGTATTDSIPAGTGFWYNKYGTGTNIVQTGPSLN